MRKETWSQLFIGDYSEQSLEGRCRGESSPRGFPLKEKFTQSPRWPRALRAGVRAFMHSPRLPCWGLCALKGAAGRVISKTFNRAQTAPHTACARSMLPERMIFIIRLLLHWGRLRGSASSSLCPYSQAPGGSPTLRVEGGSSLLTGTCPSGQVRKPGHD